MKVHPFFAPLVSFEDMFRKPWLTKVEPFKMIDNLYYVGNLTVASHLIVTDAGLVLLDTPFECQMPMLLDSIWKVGFNPADIKYIVCTHEHVDHIGCVAYLKELYGCEAYLSEVGTRNLKECPEICGAGLAEGPDFDFEVDHIIHEDDVLDFGNVKIRCRSIPGHTDGTMSFYFKMMHQGQELVVGTFGGTGFNTLTQEEMEKFHRPNARNDYFHSLDKVYDEHVDVMLGNHPNQNATFEKHEAFLKNPDGPNPFIDPSEWKRYLDTLRRLLTEFVEENPIR